MNGEGRARPAVISAPPPGQPGVFDTITPARLEAPRERITAALPRPH